MRVWIGFGSNQGDSRTMVLESIRLLDHSASLSLLRTSSLYRTRPWGQENQPDFINAAAEFTCDLAAIDLLNVLKRTETTLGRVSGPRWGPRLIDLDLLLYGAQSIRLPGLEVPHPRMHERVFVLEPLEELQPDLVIPGRGRVDDCLDRLLSQGQDRRGEKVTEK